MRPILYVTDDPSTPLPSNDYGRLTIAKQAQPTNFEKLKAPSVQDILEVCAARLESRADEFVGPDDAPIVAVLHAEAKIIRAGYRLADTNRRDEPETRLYRS